MMLNMTLMRLKPTLKK